MILGCICDDFTGASDIANTLAKGGMSVTQYNGIPDFAAERHVESGVIALKSRTAPIDEAVKNALNAARWLLDQGCEQLFFKYCSTFDSTIEGNIGPVADALARLLNEDTVIFCPAFPAAGRSVYQGNLFVNDQLLHESGMKDHPLTPMTDSDLRRWLGYQTTAAINHLPYSTVARGAECINQLMRATGPGYYIADAIEDEHLIQLGKSAIDCKLLTGGSGLAQGLPENYRLQGKITDSAVNWQGLEGSGVILSGSCSVATRAQVANYRQEFPSLEISANAIINQSDIVEEVFNWINQQHQTPLIYTSTDPAAVVLAQQEFGQECIAAQIENFFASLASMLVANGTTKIVTAGGETSGAVVTALAIEAMDIGPEITAGVPALKASNRPLLLALKSGNFGDEFFFSTAMSRLGS